MKRAGIVIGLVIVVGLAAVPFVNGIVMERIVKRSYADVNSMYEDTGSDASLELVRYDRGYSSSEIEWKINLGSMSSLYGGVEEVHLVDRAQHKFTGIVSKTSLRRNPWYDTFVDSQLGGRDPVDITTVYKLTGDIKTTVTVDSFSLEIDGERLDIGSGRLEGNASDSLQRIGVDLFWAGLKSGDEVAVNDIAIVSGLQRISTYIWEGTISAEIESGSVMLDGPASLEKLRGEYSLSYDEQQGVLTILTSLSADRFGPDAEPIEAAKVQLAVRNLDAQGYETYMDIYSNLVNAALEDVSQTPDGEKEVDKRLEEQMGSAGLQLLGASEKLLKQGLEIEVSDLLARLKTGVIEGSILIRLKKDLTFLQLLPLATQPELALEVFHVDSSLRLPAALVDDPSTLIMPLHPAMQTGLFVRSGDELVHRAETRDTTLVLNGIEVVF